MLWRHPSRDQNGPKVNIRSKSLLEPFSKNILKPSCSLINSVLKNGHDYFFIKKCGSRKSNRKVCHLPGQRPFEVGIKENFAKGLRECSIWWRCQFLLVSTAFGEDRCLKCPYLQNFYFFIRSYMSCNEPWRRNFSIWIKSDLFLSLQRPENPIFLRSTCAADHIIDLLRVVT